MTCTGEERNLIECPRKNNLLFMTNCDHSEDAAVKCNGKCNKMYSLWLDFLSLYHCYCLFVVAVMLFLLFSAVY